ncbi:TPA: cystathionine beta-synthase [Candidatus Dependentiae bacterium]|nr:MAG: Cystathionine beta-synthase [candidate division TM6 bacterium GW2011_GWE2_31_21]KKP53736.1 MAG: Cystathionine beta-synthase [candidate division TM6 bacterium GW2011_GWF2_33_332]HBS48510.1 cystathionine beta-synthase [Candidatus Dependentiae bacterium]HBZ73125.1 cystathionine beta-synthase [Candidatus Dependentiae bacterium]
MKNELKFKTLLETIGNTPIIKLDFGTNPTLLAKLEYLNPGGSIKDRSALYMIEDAEKRGLLKPGGTIIEASSGNQGIALAMIGVIKGYKVIITVPDRTSIEKINTLKAYGADVRICENTDTLEDPRSYHSMADTLHEEIEGSFMPNQYFNKKNVEAHYLTTGPEIWKQTEGKITHLFAAMGSCGTISGAAKYLKEQNPNIKVIGIDAENSKLSNPNPKAYISEGIGVDVISDTLNRAVIDQILTVNDDEVFAMTRKLAAKGFLVGLSCGAVMHIALDYCKKLSDKDIAVVLFADSGRAYLSKVFNF